MRNNERERERVLTVQGDNQTKVTGPRINVAEVFRNPKILFLIKEIVTRRVGTQQPDISNNATKVAMIINHDRKRHRGDNSNNVVDHDTKCE